MLQSLYVASSKVMNPGALTNDVDLVGFDLSECEKGKTCSTSPKFGLSIVNFVIQKAALVGKLKKKKKSFRLTRSST